MEAVTPFATVLSGAGDAAAAVGDAARVCASAFDLPADRCEAVAREAARLVDQAAASRGAQILLAPLRSPWLDALDVVLLDATGNTLRERGRRASNGLLRVDEGGEGTEWLEAELSPGLLAPGAAGVRLVGARFALATREGDRPPLDLAVCALPCPGQTVSGDAVVLGRGAPGAPWALRAAVIDALGHGPGAAASAAGLGAFLARHASLPLAGLLEAAHRERAADPRGAAVAVLDLDAQGRGAFCGVGNVDAVTVGEPQPPRPVSRAGTLGVALPRVVIDPVALAPGTSVVLATDGFTVRWPAHALAVLAALPAPLLLGAVVASGARRNDDATALVVRRRPSP